MNRQTHALAPVLNSPTIVKRHNGATYLFAVAIRKPPTTAEFTVQGLPERATAEVLGEGKRIPVRPGRFADSFEPYEVYL